MTWRHSTQAQGRQGELPLAYDVVWEHTHGHLSAPADVQGDSGLAYVYVHPLSATVGEIYNPTYRYVSHTDPNVETARKVLFEAGGVALEQRIQSLDVTVDGGIGVQPADDPDGNAYVESAVRFVVAGACRPSPTVRFSFSLPSQLDRSELRDLRAVRIIAQRRSYARCRADRVRSQRSTSLGLRASMRPTGWPGSIPQRSRARGHRNPPHLDVRLARKPARSASGRFLAVGWRTS